MLFLKILATRRLIFYTTPVVYFNRYIFGLKDKLNDFSEFVDVRSKS